MLHGARSYLLQDDNGQTIESHSICAGLDYPGVGPEHAYLHDIGRAEYRAVTDAEAMEAFALLCRTEGIIPAIESAHALAGALRGSAEELGPGRASSLVNLSGRGDKDVETASAWFGLGDREDVDPGPGLDTDQQPDRGRRRASGDAVRRTGRRRDEREHSSPSASARPRPRGGRR